MVAISDNFESQTDGTALSADPDWAVRSIVGSGVPTIDTHTAHKSGQVVDMSNDGTAYAIHQTAMATDDHKTATGAFPDSMSGAGGANDLAVLVRCQSASAAVAVNGYELRWTRTSTANELTLRRIDADLSTTLATVASGALTDYNGSLAVETIELEAVGNILTGRFNGVDEISYDITADGTKYTTGKNVALRWGRNYTASGTNAQLFLDDFAASDVGAPPARVQSVHVGSDVVEDCKWIDSGGTEHQVLEIYYGTELVWESP